MNPKNLPDIGRGSVPAANNYPTQQPVNWGTRFTSNFVQKHHLYDRGKGPKKSRTRKHVAIMGAVLMTDKSALVCPKLIHFRKQGSIVSNLIF
jgi:hypothetical protein